MTMTMTAKGPGAPRIRRRPEPVPPVAPMLRRPSRPGRAPALRPRPVGATPVGTRRPADDIERNGAERAPHRTEEGASIPSPPDGQEEKGHTGNDQTARSRGRLPAFHLGGTDKTWLYICLIAGVVGIVAGLLARPQRARLRPGHGQDEGDRPGDPGGGPGVPARQFRAIVMIIIPLAILIFFTATAGGAPRRGVAPTFQQDGLYRVICFLFGAAFRA